MANSDNPRESRARKEQQRRRQRRVRYALVLTGAVVVGVLVLTAYQASQTRTALTDAAARFQQVGEAVAAGDSGRAREALFAAQDSTRTAQHNTAGPVWWAAGKLPGIGDDVIAVRTLVDVADDVGQRALPGVVDASESLSPQDLQPTDGRIDLAGIEAVVPALAEASAVLDENAARVAGLDPSQLSGQVAGPVRDVQSQFMDAIRLARTTALAAQLLPPMLGAEEKRTYLVLFQNNAEIRATGGIPGAVAIISADDGSLSLDRQTTAAELGPFGRPVLPLTRAEAALFGEQLGIFPADITFTPDFPRTAELGQAMWEQRTGQRVDGVVSLDPVALSYLLRGTGPVAVGGEQLRADNAVSLLLNEIYLTQANAETQNDFYAESAQSVFRALTSGQGDARTVLAGFARAAVERRALIWSDDEEDQSLLAPTAAGGVLPTVAGDAPAVGVYLNDGTGAKMDYYLDYDVDVRSTGCNAREVQNLEATVTMRSTAPPDARTLPASVIGPGFGARPGTVRTNVLVYAPVGGDIGKATMTRERLISARFEHQGRQVAAQTIDLAPGEERVLTFPLTSGPGQPGEADVRVTPGLPGSGTTEIGPSACR